MKYFWGDRHNHCAVSYGQGAPAQALAGLRLARRFDERRARCGQAASVRDAPTIVRKNQPIVLSERGAGCYRSRTAEPRALRNPREGIWLMSPPPTASSPTSSSTDDVRWFAEEVQPHGPSLKAYLRGSFPSLRDVDDLVQESYLRLWRARTTQQIRSARAFVFQVARRLAIDLLRRRESSRIEPVCDLAALSVMEERPDVADAVCQSEELRLLAQAIHILPGRCREVMILRKIEGLSQKEIAARLGITEGTVQVHIGRGLRHLEDFFLNLDSAQR